MKLRNHLFGFCFPLFSAVALLAHFTAPSVVATVIYWDPQSSGGFGTINGTDTWAPGLDKIWTTSNTGGSTRLVTYTTTLSDDVNFGGPVSALGGGTVPVGTVNAKTISFNTISGTGIVTLSGGTITLVAATTITVNNTSDTITSTLAGAATSLTKLGTGTLILSGPNTYAGKTIINDGILKISDSSNLGSASATNTITFNGGTLESTANSYDLTANRKITLTGTGTIQSDAGTLTVSGAITNGGNLLTVAGAGNTIISSVIGAGATPTGGLNKTGAGSLTFSGANSNTYTGLTTVAKSVNSNGALILAKSGGAIAIAGDLTVGDATASQAHVILGGSNQIATSSTVTFNGVNSGWGYLQLQGNSQTISNVVETKAGFGVIETREGAGTFGTSTITFDVASGTQNYQGYFRDINTGTDTNNSLALVKTGSGILQFGAASNGTGSAGTSAASHRYTGGTTIANGTLQITTATGTSTALSIVGTNGVTIDGGATFAGTLDLNGVNASMTGLNGIAGTVLGQVVNNLTGTATLTVGSNNTSGSFAGLIEDNNNAGSGVLALTKTGTGTQTLSGANTYTGPTTVNAGTLLVQNSSGSGTGSGAVTVTAGPTHGTLGGTGKIDASSITVSGDVVTPTNNAVLMVGNTHNSGGSAQTLTLGATGNITLGGMLQFDILGRTPTDTTNSYSAPTYATQTYAQASSNDQLIFTSANNIAISGILEVVPMDGSAFIAGDTWKLIDWTSLTAHTVAFTDFHLPTLSGSNTWDVLTDQTNFNTFGTISVIAVPEPSRALLMFFGAAGLMLRRRRRSV